MVPILAISHEGDTSLVVSWSPPQPLLLEFREFPKPWATATRVDVPGTPSPTYYHQLTGLTPQSTYEVRASLPGGTPEWGPAVAGDTLPVGCTKKGGGAPKPKKAAGGDSSCKTT